jgi:hypothetical protein
MSREDFENSVRLNHYKEILLENIVTEKIRCSSYPSKSKIDSDASIYDLQSVMKDIQYLAKTNFSFS